MATTRHGQSGIGVKPYLGFSPKTPASSPKASGKVTRLTSMGIGGRRRVDGKGRGQFTRLTSMGINGRTVEFEPKTPAIPPIETIVTRLLSYGIGGKRVAFEPKTPIDTTPTGGGKIPKKKKKVFTQEELEGLEAYGKARLGIVEKVEEILPSIVDEIPILSQESIVVLDEPELVESQVSHEIDDIALILAIMEAVEG